MMWGDSLDEGALLSSPRRCGGGGSVLPCWAAVPRLEAVLGVSGTLAT